MWLDRAQFECDSTEPLAEVRPAFSFLTPQRGCRGGGGLAPPGMNRHDLVAKTIDRNHPSLPRRPAKSGFLVPVCGSHRGEAVFAAAKAALERWDQFRLGWLEASPADTPIRSGEVVAILARSAGLSWLVACRIIYVINENGPITRFGFAYGTLPDHAATGEERFLIEWIPADDSVWYDILAFSRPRHRLARWGYPVIRRMQKRFGRESAAAVLRAVGSNSHPT